MKRLRTFAYVAGALVLAAVIVITGMFGRLWYHLRPVVPHVQMTFYQSRNCKLYIAKATPQDFQFIGAALHHNVDTRGEIVHQIGVSGIGTVTYKSTNIKVDYDQVSVGDQILVGNPCSYVLQKSGRVQVGAISADE